MPTRTKLQFPLPRDYFGRVQATAAQKLEYRDLVRHRVDVLLDDERHYLERKASKLPCLPPADWKHVRSHQQLQIYCRRKRGRSLDEVAAEEDFADAADAVANGQPSIVATGSIAGTMENLLYGLADTNYEEMRTTTSFLDTHTDAAVLRVFELATPDDPVHFLGLKWMYNSSAPLVEPRDVCFLAAMGVERDANDEKFGYLVLHSVDLPECPPFDHAQAKVIRGKLFFCCLFRDAAPGMVDVVLRGVFDTTRELRRLSMPYASLMPYATAAFVGGLSKAVSCAEAKKLTLLARYNAVSGKNRDALNVDAENPKHGLCSVCIRPVGTGVLSFIKLRWCRICGIAVCSRCRVKGTRVFLGLRRPHSPCVCCPNCAQEARQMTGMMPAEPEYAVVADYFMDPLWLTEEQTESTSLLSSPSLWREPVKDGTFRDWKQDRPGPLVTLVDARNLDSSVNRTTSSSLDASSKRDESQESIMELSDDDTARCHLIESSDEADSYYVFYSPVSMDSDFGQRSVQDLTHTLEPPTP